MMFPEIQNDVDLRDTELPKLTATGCSGRYHRSSLRLRRSMHWRRRHPFIRKSLASFGSLADILTSPRLGRFTLNHGRWAAHPHEHFAA